MNRNDMIRIVYFLVSLLGFTKLAAQDPADFVLPSIITLIPQHFDLTLFISS